MSLFGIPTVSKITKSTSVSEEASSYSVLCNLQLCLLRSFGRLSETSEQTRVLDRNHKKTSQYTPNHIFYLSISTIDELILLPLHIKSQCCMLIVLALSPLSASNFFWDCTLGSGNFKRIK